MNTQTLLWYRQCIKVICFQWLNSEKCYWLNLRELPPHYILFQFLWSAVGTECLLYTQSEESFQTNDSNLKTLKLFCLASRTNVTYISMQKEGILLKHVKENI